MKRVRIQSERFDAGHELTPLTQSGAGAVASFTGIARADLRDDVAVVAIELEHYPAMTLSSLERLVAEAEARWDLTDAMIIHRVGRIEVGEEIVLVATSSSHRKNALEACTFLIDRLKTDTPFWKKEYYADGRAIWVDAKESDEAAARHWLS